MMDVAKFEIFRIFPILYKALLFLINLSGIKTNEYLEDSHQPNLLEVWHIDFQNQDIQWCFGL